MRAYRQRACARENERNEMARKKPKNGQKPKRIGFGKYTGRRWVDLPNDYLMWVCRETWEPSSHALASQVLLSRGVSDFHREPPQKPENPKHRRTERPVMSQLDQEFRNIVTG